MIKIGIPYIEDKNNKSRLCSRIQIDKNEYEIYYEVDSKYKEYLCFETADSFLVAILHLAMEREENIVSEAPISEKLYYQLNNSLIPALAKYIYNKEIKIIAEVNKHVIPKGNAVGTGLSSGVDSFHAISTHIALQTPSYNITHLTFFNVGSHGKGEKGYSLYKDRLTRAEKLSKKLGFELVAVDTNISDFINMSFVQTHTFRSYSAVLALQKFFKIYYYASGFPINEFKISSESSAYYDVMNALYLSTENIDFYSVGIEKSRLEKVKQIWEYEPSRKYLNVCLRQDTNCGICEKCIRTQLELYCIGKLELYNKVFDLNKFNSKLNSHLGYMLANQRKKVYKEIKNTLKLNNHSIPIMAYIHASKFITIKILKRLKIMG